MRITATFLVLALSGGIASGLWAAPQAVLQSLKGKVEIKAAGSKVWATAAEGQVLKPATTLSTGFDSSVVVVIDQTTIQVKPLTRMTIDKLVEESGTVKTSTFLRVGNVSASVKSAEGVKQDFKVQSPYSTASVRGTKFDYNGLKLKVREGLVALILGRSKRDKQPEEAVETPVAESTETKTDGGEGTPVPGDVTEETPAEETSGDETSETTSETESDEDFVGAPDVEADEDEAVFVPAGKDAKVKVDFKNTGERPKSTGSSDKENLDKAAGTGAPPEKKSTQDKAPTKGGVKLQIEFGS